MEVECSLGFLPTDREFQKLGHDVESSVLGTGKLHFVEVKGRVYGAETIKVTRNEILYSLNKPDDFILAIVKFFGRRYAQGALCAPARQTRARFWRHERQ